MPRWTKSIATKARALRSRARSRDADSDTGSGSPGPSSPSEPRRASVMVELDSEAIHDPNLVGQLGKPSSPELTTMSGDAASIESPAAVSKLSVPWIHLTSESGSAVIQAPRIILTDDSQATASDFETMEVVDDLGFGIKANSGIDQPRGRPYERYSEDHLRESMDGSLPEEDTGIAEHIESLLMEHLQQSSLGSSRHTEDLCFIPDDDLFRILDSRRVMRYLGSICPDLAMAELQDLVEMICRKDGRGMTRVMATLFMIGRPESIMDFIRYGIFDRDLPLRASTSPGDRLSNQRRVLTREQKDNDKPLGIFQDWTMFAAKSFYAAQYRVVIPRFALNTYNLCYYRMDERIVLPFIDRDIHAVGGYSTISKIRIHPAHIDLGITDMDLHEQNPYFALKEILSKNYEEFHAEVLNLERFGGSRTGHPHLIRLLMALQHGNKYFLVFPWAEFGNLKVFCQQHRASPSSPENVRWFAKQSAGVASALKKLHHHSSWENLKDRSKAAVNRGRHGDIKPENILCFEDKSSKPSRLVLSDFGVTRFHTAKAIKKLPHEFIPGFTPTYRPPEYDLGGHIQQSSDIWSLGCVYLQYVSWFLLDFDSAWERFSELRLEDDTPYMRGFPEDKFFDIVPDPSGDPGQVTGKVKSSVQNWIQNLHKNPHCTQFIHDFLDVIQTYMLVPNPKERHNITSIQLKLRELLSRCMTDQAYCVNSCSWVGPPITVKEAVIHGQMKEITRPTPSPSSAKTQSHPLEDQQIKHVLHEIEVSKSRKVKQADDLREEIEKSLVKSVAIFGGNEFLPADQITTLLTDDVVRSVLISEGLEPTEPLVNFVVREARIVFLTLHQTRNILALTGIREDNFTDACLPVSKTRSRTAEGRFQWSVGALKKGQSTNDSAVEKWPGFKKWSSLQIENFIEYQWLFLAPIFGKPELLCVLPFSTPLPFLKAVEHVSSIYKVWIHPSHLEQSINLYHDGTIPVIALRVFQPHLVRRFHKELAILSAVKQVAHPKLMQPITGYERGEARGIILPWAPGGNLHEFWARESIDDLHPLSEPVFGAAVLQQIVEIVDGLAALHNAGYCHGNLKPENILNLSAEIGEADFVLTDIGRAASRNEDYLTYSATKTSFHSAARYMPPEYMLRRVPSSEYDVWAIGGIILEFILWGFRGKERLDLFVKEVTRFWDRRGNDCELNLSVQSVLEELAMDSQVSSPFKQVLQVLRENMLVAALSDESSKGQARANISDVAKRMHHIVEISDSTAISLAVGSPSEPGAQDMYISEDGSVSVTDDNAHDVQAGIPSISEGLLSELKAQVERSSERPRTGDGNENVSSPCTDVPEIEELHQPAAEVGLRQRQTNPLRDASSQFTKSQGSDTTSFELPDQVYTRHYTGISKEIAGSDSSEVPTWSKSAVVATAEETEVPRQHVTSGLRLVNFLRRFTRPRLRADQERLEWICSCGVEMYGDFDKSSPAALEKLGKQFNRQFQNANNKAFTSGMKLHAAPYTKRYGLRFWSYLNNYGFYQRNPGGRAPTTNVPQGNAGLPMQGNAQPSNTATVPSTSNKTLAAGGQPSTTQAVTAQGALGAAYNKPAFLELCVNVGRYEVRLGEIALASITSDQSLFDAIWSHYRNLRGHGLRRFFVKPTDVHFIHFGVFHRQTVGIYAKPLEIPPPVEVQNQSYHYFECPLEPLPPMPPNVFLHYLNCAKHREWRSRHPAAHQEDTFLQRLPKKLGASIFQSVRGVTPNIGAVSYGWGVHIIEGPNMKAMSWLLVLGTVISFLASVLFIYFAQSQEQGFGIGQWVLAVLAEILAALYFYFSEC